MDWRQIETAPAKRGEYMVASAKTGQVRMAKWYPMTQIWKFAHWQQSFSVTHWMPLPEPPEAP